MTEEIVARRLFKEQIRKELLDEIKKYKVGLIYNGEMTVRKGVDVSNGYIFIIPEFIYKELFKEM